MIALATVLALPSFPSARALERDGDGALDEFHRRRALLVSDDSKAWMSLAQWAAENHLLDEADRLCRELLRRIPDHPEAYRTLETIAETRPLSVESAARTAAKALLPPRFVDHETSRFVVISDADVNWTRHQAERIERAHHQFQRFVRRFDLKPLPLEHKLVCILFEERDDYQRFATEHDHVSDPSIGGYYSPTHQRMVFYNPRSNPSAAEARSRLEAMERELAELVNDAERGAAGNGPDGRDALRQEIARHQRQFQREAERLVDFIDEVSIATTVHEAIHQLMFETGIQSAAVEYPLWISEGLATSFETVEPSQAFGPDHEHASRRDTFNSYLHQDRLLPLEVLVKLTSLPDGGEDTPQRVYAQSYALVTWMSRFRRTELRAYLLAMRREPAGRPRPKRHLEIFESAFGDVAQLERTWLRHERSRAAPVEVSDAEH